MNIANIDTLNLAIEFAANAHLGQFRKTTNTPYIAHPYMVGTMLLEVGCATEVVVAGYLHDVLEDTAVKADEIAALFGQKVLAIVEGCSEPDKSYSWEYRKEYTLDYLQENATKEVLYVVCADKLHNIRSLNIQYAILDETIWEHFNRGKKKQQWYYEAVFRILKSKISNFPLCQQLEIELNTLFR